jgi:hypothetical protein
MRSRYWAVLGAGEVVTIEKLVIGFSIARTAHAKPWPSGARLDRWDRVRSA